MSSENETHAESGAYLITPHTKQPDCPECQKRKELFGFTTPTCYESYSSQAGEDTKRF